MKIRLLRRIGVAVDSAVFVSPKLTILLCGFWGTAAEGSGDIYAVP